MRIIRQIIGIAYILMVLIIAFDIIYHIVHGLIPLPVKDLITIAVSFMDQFTSIVCAPVEFVINKVVSILPGFIQSFFPVTKTDFFGATILWVPVLTLFLYTSIIKTIDDFFLKQKVEKIHSNYTSQNSGSYYDNL